MAELLTGQGGKRTTYLAAQSAPAKSLSSRAFPLTPEEAQSLERHIQSLRSTDAADPVFVPQGSAQEHATPLQRSFALILRLLPFTVIWFVLSLAVVWMLDVDEGVGYLFFALLTALTYYRMDRTEREFSTNGIERYRIDVAATLAREKMRADVRLRREITQAYLKHLEGPDHDEDPQKA